MAGAEAAGARQIHPLKREHQLEARSKLRGSKRMWAGRYSGVLGWQLVVSTSITLPGYYILFSLSF